MAADWSCVGTPHDRQSAVMCRAEGVRANWESKLPTHPFTNASVGACRPVRPCSASIVCSGWVREDGEGTLKLRKTPFLPQLLLQLCAPSVAGPPFVLASWPPFVCAACAPAATLCRAPCALSRGSCSPSCCAASLALACGWGVPPGFLRGTIPRTWCVLVTGGSCLFFSWGWRAETLLAPLLSGYWCR